MGGIPFGAKRGHEVASELRTFEAIWQISYIHDALLPADFCSAAYLNDGSSFKTRTRTTLEGALVDTELSEQDARTYIEALIDAGIFDWMRVYKPAQGTFVKYSTEWRLQIDFAKPEAGRTPKPFVVEGENCFPDNYELIQKLLMSVPRQNETAPSEED